MDRTSGCPGNPSTVTLGSQLYPAMPTGGATVVDGGASSEDEAAGNSTTGAGSSSSPPPPPFTVTFGSGSSVFNDTNPASESSYLIMEDGSLAPQFAAPGAAHGGAFGTAVASSEKNTTVVLPPGINGTQQGRTSGNTSSSSSSSVSLLAGSGGGGNHRRALSQSVITQAQLNSLFASVDGSVFCLPFFAFSLVSPPAMRVSLKPRGCVYSGRGKSVSSANVGRLVLGLVTRAYTTSSLSNCLSANLTSTQCTNRFSSVPALAYDTWRLVDPSTNPWLASVALQAELALIVRGSVFVQFINAVRLGGGVTVEVGGCFIVKVELPAGLASFCAAIPGCNSMLRSLLPEVSACASTGMDGNGFYLLAAGSIENNFLLGVIKSVVRGNMQYYPPQTFNLGGAIPITLPITQRLPNRVKAHAFGQVRFECYFICHGRTFGGSLMEREWALPSSVE